MSNRGNETSVDHLALIFHLANTRIAGGIICVPEFGGLSHRYKGFAALTHTGKTVVEGKSNSACFHKVTTADRRARIRHCQVAILWFLTGKADREADDRHGGACRGTGKEERISAAGPCLLDQKRDFW